ncbi:MAG: AEC family transporter [Puniceicoccaceae bacterium]|nr:MAG: AEC family transporter [Puniceicoccaceae bacterium]
MLLTVFLQICLPIFVLAGLGWLLDRRWSLDLKTMVKLNINLVVPAFIFVRVATSELEGAMAMRVMGFTLSIMAAMFLLGELAGRLRGDDLRRRRALQLSAMFYNSGNYGLPLLALAYPTDGPVVQVFVLLTMNVTTFSIGLLIASSGGGYKGWRMWLPVLRQTSLWGVALALAVRGFEIPVTEWTWFWVPLTYLANAMIGLALVTLGVQLSQTRPGRMLGQVSPSLAIRLVGGPLIAFGLVHAFGFSGNTAAILILGAGVPTAVNISLLAHEFKADHAFLAAAVFYSTLLSMATVTIVATLLRLFW